MLMNAGTKGRLKDCFITGNKESGVQITDGADPSLHFCM